MNNQINLAGEQLEDAFELFNQFSAKLADSYGDLESHVARLTKELAEARNERLVQLAEKEVLANRLESLLDALPAGIVVLDSSDYITQANPVARLMLGLDEVSVSTLNGKWSDVAQHSIISTGNELRLKDGRWVTITACPVSACMASEENGKILLIADISETRKLQNKLNRQQRLSSLGEMVASLAHQVRTPLSSAILYISTINHPNNDRNESLSFAEKAKERLYHLERMVNDMLVFARGDVTASEYINAFELMAQLESLLESEERREIISLTCDAALKEITIQANNDALLSALQNIINNAIESFDCVANNNSALIEIDALLNHQKQFEITIKDNACGMSEQTKERILEPFYTTKTSGTGLGLAVVNNTVAQYGGELLIDSVKGEGSNFKLTFPCAQTNALLCSEVSRHRDNVVTIKPNNYQMNKTLNIAAKHEVTL